MGIEFVIGFVFVWVIFYGILFVFGGIYVGLLNMVGFCLYLVEGLVC